MTNRDRIGNILKKIGISVVNDKYYIDSLKRITLWYELEREFDIVIDDEDFWKTQEDTISCLVELVEKYINYDS